jgi:hypothetical protein
MLNNLGGRPPLRERYQQELGFSWSWSFFETDLFLLGVGSLPHTGGKNECGLKGTRQELATTAAVSRVRGHPLAR